MDLLNKEDLKNLLEITDDYCVSLYMPTHKTGRKQQQDPIRFGNLIAKAQDRLLEYGLRKPQVQDLMRPAEILFSDQDFWQHQSDGLAIFLSSGFSQHCRLPSRFDELMMIAKNFHIKPLIPLLNKNGKFYLLAISMNKVRLFQGTRDTINEIELPNVPKNMQEALYTDDPEKHLDFHTGTNNSNASGNRPAVFHGQGVQSDEQGKKDLLRYFQIVDTELGNSLNDQSIPMIVACVDYLLPIYRQANNYPHLLNNGLPGNPDEFSEKELHKRAWEMLEPLFGKEQQNAIDQFTQLHGQQSKLVSDDLKTVVKATGFGMVDKLFLHSGVHHWGRFDISKNQVMLKDEPDLENGDLMNYAASQTILNSGQVFVLQMDESPLKTDIAAILRYENS